MSNLCSKANALGIWLLPAGTWWLETEVVHGSLGLCVQRISKLYSLQTKKGVDRVIYSYAVLELLFFIRVGLLRSGSRSSNRCLQEWWLGRILLNGFAASLKQLAWARWPRGLMFCSRSLARGWPTHECPASVQSYGLWPTILFENRPAKQTLQPYTIFHSTSRFVPG